MTNLHRRPSGENLIGSPDLVFCVTSVVLRGSSSQTSMNRGITRGFLLKCGFWFSRFGEAP